MYVCVSMCVCVSVCLYGYVNSGCTCAAESFINPSLKCQPIIKLAQTVMPVESLRAHDMSLTANVVAEHEAKLRK